MCVACNLTLSTWHSSHKHQSTAAQILPTRHAEAEQPLHQSLCFLALCGFYTVEKPHWCFCSSVPLPDCKTSLVLILIVSSLVVSRPSSPFAMQLHVSRFIASFLLSLLSFSCPVHEHDRHLLLTGWNSVVWHFCFPINRARTVYKKSILFLFFLPTHRANRGRQRGDIGWIRPKVYFNWNHWALGVEIARGLMIWYYHDTLVMIRYCHDFVICWALQNQILQFYHFFELQIKSFP